MIKRLPMPMLPGKVDGRTCWSCNHIVFRQALPGFSEYTPGSDFALYCGKDYWDFDTFQDNLKQFRENLQSAERCADFEGRDNK